MTGDGAREREAREVWMSQPVVGVEIPLEELGRRARRLEGRISWRNAREYVSAALVVGVFGYGVVSFPPPLIRLGCVLMIAGTVYSMVALHRQGSARRVPAGLAGGSCLDFHRDELRRQRDLLLGVWRWYLLPLVPGLLVFLTGGLVQALQLPGVSARRGVVLAGFGAVTLAIALLLLGVAKLNHWAARRLQRELDALDQAARGA